MLLAAVYVVVDSEIALPNSVQERSGEPLSALYQTLPFSSSPSTEIRISMYPVIPWSEYDGVPPVSTLEIVVDVTYTDMDTGLDSVTIRAVPDTTFKEISWSD